MKVIVLARAAGMLLTGFGGLMAVPLLVALATGETAHAGGFVGAAGLTIFIGVSLLITTRGISVAATRREAILITVLSWPLCAAMGALPLVFSGTLPSPVDAMFEAVSGLTTTGLSVIATPLDAARSLYFWRAELQWIGGLATIILAYSVLPPLGLGGAEYSTGTVAGRRTESHGLRLKQALRLFGPVYGGLTLLCMVALWLAGMPGLDALTVAMSTISTGGFMTPDGQSAAGSSPVIRAVLMIFMIGGAMSFMLHTEALRGRIDRYWRNLEGQLMASLIGVATVVIVVAALASVDQANVLAILAAALFDVVSAVTTTGFSLNQSSDYGLHTLVPVMVILALAGLGGSSGSTSGGLKLVRGMLLIRQGRREMRLLTHPHAVIPIKVGPFSVSGDMIHGTWALFVAYLFCVIAVAVGLAAFDLDFGPALPLAISAVANAGALPIELAAGDLALHAMTDGAKWMLGIAMIVGRLEVLAVLVILSPVFWRR